MVCLFGVCLIETLRSDLEPQFLHCLENMVVALEYAHFQIAERVVALLVVHVEQRRYLRKHGCDVLHKTFCALLVALLVVMELYDDHPLPGVGVAYHDVAQEPVLLPEVEEGHADRQRIVAYRVAYAVVQVVHEHAPLYRQYLVERSCDVESDGVHACAVEAVARRYLLFREPLLV